MDPITNIPASFQIMTWCGTGDKLVSEAIVTYCQVSNISRTFVGDKIVNHSDVDGASPVGAAPTTSSFSTSHLA